MKLNWSGKLLGVQPRIRLTRSFDQRYHTYLGYLLRVTGVVEGEAREFLVAIGKAAQAKLELRAGDEIQGGSEPVADDRTETAEFYETSGLKVIERSSMNADPPPWLGLAPNLEIYRARGHRRLAAKTYEAKCQCCMWGCQMAVEMIIDQWNQSNKRYRTETFCYGPKSCKFYSPGPTRKVPGRRGMSWEEEDWVDEEATRHREMDE